MSTSFLLFICSPSCTWWLIRNCKEIQSSHSKNCWELYAPPSNLKQSNIWPDELYYRILLIRGLSEGNFLTEDSYSLRWSSACVLSHFSHVQLFATLWTVVLQVLCPWDSPGKNTGVGCHALLWGSSWPRSNLSLVSLKWAGRFFTISATWGAQGEVDMNLNESLTSEALGIENTGHKYLEHFIQGE